MEKALFAVVAGVFVGSAVYIVATRKATVLTTAKDKVLAAAKKTCQIATDARRSFAEGFCQGYAQDAVQVQTAE